MLEGLYIIAEDEFGDPIYADPDPEDLDEDLWVAACEAVNEAVEGDGLAQGAKAVGEHLVVWKTLTRLGLSFVAIVTDDVKEASIHAYLNSLSKAYLDEVDDPHNPERDGVEDVVVDVIPPWEDEDDD